MSKSSNVQRAERELNEVFKTQHYIFLPVKNVIELELKCNDNVLHLSCLARCEPGRATAVACRTNAGIERHGWVDKAFVRPHPLGAEGKTGRIDPRLQRRGDRSVTLVSGETLSSIALEEDVSIKELEVLNADHILDLNLLFPGDVIYWSDATDEVPDAPHHMLRAAEFSRSVQEPG